MGYGGWISSPWIGYTSLYVAADKNILLDAGEGVYHKISQCGLQLPDAVVLTHNHGDHILGLPTLLLWARQAGRRISVIAPAAAAESVDKLLEAVSMRHLAEHAEMKTLEPGGEVVVGGTRIRSASAKHSVAAVHVRVEYAGKCVVYTGDSAPTAELVELARGCDVLIHEVSANPGYEEIAHSIGHSTTADAVEAARRAGVRALLPIHFYTVPPILPPSAVNIVVPYPCAALEI